MAKIKRTRAAARCCVVDKRGRTFGCFATEREAEVAREILTKSPLGVACRVKWFGKAKRKRRRR